MTNKDVSIIIGNIPIEGDDCYTIAEYQEAKARAIQALEQQPTGEKTYLKRREENYVEYNVEWFLKNWELELEILSGGKIKPTDAVSRQAVIDHINLYPKIIGNRSDLALEIKHLPPVTPQPFINKPCISEGICREDKIQVLEKIRAEIDNIEEGISSYHNDRPWVFKDEVLRVIDKYRKGGAE